MLSLILGSFYSYEKTNNRFYTNQWKDAILSSLNLKSVENTTGNIICYITQRRPQHTIAAISKKPLHKGLPLDLFQLYIYSVLSSSLQMKSNFVS